MTASSAGSPGSTTSRATRSASMTTTPGRSPSQPATVDFPQPIGPVSPIRERPGAGRCLALIHRPGVYGPARPPGPCPSPSSAGRPAVAGPASCPTSCCRTSELPDQLVAGPASCPTSCCRTSCCRTRSCRTSELPDQLLPDHELPDQLLPFHVPPDQLLSVRLEGGHREPSRSAGRRCPARRSGRRRRWSGDRAAREPRGCPIPVEDGPRLDRGRQAVVEGRSRAAARRRRSPGPCR